jgi:hypothetical protein
VISATENLNKFQKTRFWKQKSVEDVVTLGPTAQATLVGTTIEIYNRVSFFVDLISFIKSFFIYNFFYKFKPEEILGCMETVVNSPTFAKHLEITTNFLCHTIEKQKPSVANVKLRWKRAMYTNFFFLNIKKIQSETPIKQT